MKANATGLVRRYVMARAAVETLVDVDASCLCLDGAIAEEAEAEEALRLHVKLANGQDATRPLRHPIAASLEGTLVVVAPDPSCDWDEIILVINRREIACGE